MISLKRAMVAEILAVGDRVESAHVYAGEQRGGKIKYFDVSFDQLPDDLDLSDFDCIAYTQSYIYVVSRYDGEADIRAVPVRHMSISVTDTLPSFGGGG